MVIIVPSGPALHSLQSAFPFPVCPGGGPVGLSPSVTAKGTEARAGPPGCEPPCLLASSKGLHQHPFPLVGTPSLPVGLPKLAPNWFGNEAPSPGDSFSHPHPLLGHCWGFPPRAWLSWTPGVRLACLRPSAWGNTRPPPGLQPCEAQLSSHPVQKVPWDPPGPGGVTFLCPSLATRFSNLLPRLGVETDRTSTETGGCGELGGTRSGCR